MLDMDRFQRGGGISRSLGRDKSPRRSPGNSKVVTPDLRPRGGVVGDVLLPSDGARHGGNIQMRRQASASKAESDGKVKIPTQHNVEGSSKKACGTPVKILMEKEMQNHVESRRHSPSVIAKLMGLDPLPAQQSHNMQKESVMFFHKGSSEASPEKHISCEERKQEFKDIFEVLEAKAVEKPNWHAAKGLLSSRRRDKEMAIKQRNLMGPKHLSTDNKLQNSQKFSEASKILDPKHLSTDNKLQNSQKFSEASKILDSSKDLCVKFLEEPAPLFEKYLRDLHSVPATPEASHITILKSSNISRHGNSELFQKSERKRERNTPMGWNAMHKPEADIFIPSVKEHTVYHSRKLSKSKLGRNIEVSSLPTRIVVLKPSLEKGQKSATVQGTPENVQSGNLGYRKHREFRRSGSLGLFSDLRERQELFDDVEVTRRMKGSREIAKEITKQMRHTVTGDCLSSHGRRDSIFPGHGNLHGMPGASARIDSEAMRQISGHVDGWPKSYSSSYLTETYASREARKHLSERWMMTHKFQEVGLAGDGVSTLGEMLALSDRETPDMHSSSLSCQERSHVRLCGREVSARWISPSGISSRDGWKDGSLSRLPRSKSLPTSSTVYGTPNSADIHGINHTDNPFMLKDILNLGSRKFSVEKSCYQRCVLPFRDVKNCASTSQASCCDEDENKLPVREIHVDQNKIINGLDSENSPVEKFALLESSARGIPDTTYLREIHVDQNKVICGLDSGNLPVEEFAVSESSACSISDSIYLVDCTPVACDVGPVPPCLTAEQQLAQSLGSSAPEAYECSPADYEKIIVEKEMLNDQPKARSPLSPTCVTGQAFSVIDTEVEQASPISVLEPPDENECGPESFEKVSADLQELRMQLELLKLESRDTYDDRFVVSDDSVGGEITDVQTAGGAPPTFRDEEDRDFSYLLNVLSDSGFHNADWDALLSALYSPESPVCPDVFEKLEKIYGGVTWSIAERKLLFDVINSVLGDILGLNMNQHRWARPRREGLIGFRKNLAEEVWQSLVRRRTVVIGDASGSKFIDDIKWLDLADDIDSIGREVERMLKDDLLEELISDIVPMWIEGDKN